MSNQPPVKKIKIQKLQSDQFKELMIYRDEIKKLTSSKDIEPPQEIEYIVDDNDDDIKIFIQNEIRESEMRINQRLDKLDRKLNLLLEKFVDNYQEEEEESQVDEVQEEHVIEYIQENDDSSTVDELSPQIFPITDEGTFDWFMTRLKDENYRNSLIASRWELAKNVGTRSFNVAVKDFMLMHVELAVCIKYSVSGYGSRGTKKKKLDAPTIVKYVFECFNRVNPGANSYQEVSKAVTQFWGRSQDNFSKTTVRSVKRELNQKVVK